jgi:hypothetical protein
MGVTFADRSRVFYQTIFHDVMILADFSKLTAITSKKTYFTGELRPILNVAPRGKL